MDQHEKQAKSGVASWLPPADQRGLSVLEVIVASAILVMVAWQLMEGVTTNMSARTKIELQRQVTAVESALRTAAFKKMSGLVESGVDCDRPKAAFEATWATQSFREARFALVPPVAATAARVPPEMARRCQSQTHAGKARRGFYFCLEVQAGPASADTKTFLARNDVYAEVFYALWDARLDRGVVCDRFNGTNTPVRGAKMYYTLYWRPKAGTSERQGDKFFRHAGTMYGQTKSP